MFRLFTVLLFAGIASAATAQINIDEDWGVKALMDHRKTLNFQKNRTVKAWSVQIMVTRDKYEANEKKYEVQRRFPDLKVDWFYEEPYYRLNVGGFYTKVDAAGLQYRLSEFYPDAYVFKNPRARPVDFVGVSRNEE